MKMMRLKIGVAAAAAVAGLIVAAPSAYAMGNCYHYGIAGWAQVFTQPNYTGDCFEWQLGTYTPFPSYMYEQDASLRSWGLWYGQQGGLDDNVYGDGFTFLAGVDYTALPESIYNKADAGQ